MLLLRALARSRLARGLPCRSAGEASTTRGRSSSVWNSLHTMQAARCSAAAARCAAGSSSGLCVARSWTSSSQSIPESSWHRLHPACRRGGSFGSPVRCSASRRVCADARALPSASAPPFRSFPAPSSPARHRSRPVHRCRRSWCNIILRSSSSLRADNRQLPGLARPPAFGCQTGWSESGPTQATSRGYRRRAVSGIHSPQHLRAEGRSNHRRLRWSSLISLTQSHRPSSNRESPVGFPGAGSHYSPWTCGGKGEPVAVSPRPSNGHRDHFMPRRRSATCTNRRCARPASPTRV